MFLLKS